MSKYKAGDKFIIAIGEVFENYDVYKAEGINTLYLNDAQLDKLKKIEENEDEISQQKD